MGVAGVGVRGAKMGNLGKGTGTTSPPGYRPANASGSSPAVYRPNAAVAVQGKSGTTHPPVYRPANTSVSAPPVYRPNAAASLQGKSGTTHPPVYRPANTSVSGPPVYRPNAAVSLQGKSVVAHPQGYRPANAPGLTRAVYKPNVAAAQRKPGVPVGTAPARVNQVIRSVQQAPSRPPARIVPKTPFMGGASIQRMLRDEGPGFGQLLGLNQYVQTPTMIMTSARDDDRETRYRNSVKNYQGLNCKILNDKSITYDPDEGTSDISKKLKTKIKGAQILVVTGHGNLQWLFGGTPGNEQPFVERFVEYIHQLEETCQLKLETIVLDSCWSAAELKEPIEGIPNDSQARILSRCLGKKYQVIGFNGKACDNFVMYMTDEGKKTKAPYGENAVVFCNGEVIKGSIHSSPGSGIYHDTDDINPEKREFYERVFSREKPQLYRTNSFSDIKL